MRRAADSVLSTVPARFAAVEERVSRVESGLEANTALTQRVFDNTSTIVAAVEWVDRTRRGFVWISKYVLIPIAATITAVYAAAEAIATHDISAWVTRIMRRGG